jgi:copper chaperone
MAETVAQTFQVEGIHCASCGMLIDEAVEELDGVTRSETKLRTRQTTVELDPQRCSPDDVVAAITAAGYRARWRQP